ncbi:hypothetical protein LTS17_002087 [Exophiala oligosperma]
MGLASKLAASQAAYPGGPPTSLQPGGGAPPGGYVSTYIQSHDGPMIDPIINYD